MTKESLRALLADPTFIDSLISRLLGNQSHHIVRYPQVKLPPWTPDPNEIEIIRDSFLGDDESFNAVLDAGELNPPEYSNHFHRRDTLLTGAALAAVINEHIHGVPAVINDVDLFYYQLNSKNQEGVSYEIYENIVDSSFNYRIVKNRRKGILNLVKIMPELDFVMEDVLRSFDLSYAKVGIVLGEKRMIYSEQFLDFLLDRNLTIAEENELDHMIPSYIRGVVKAKELGAKFYLGDYMRKMYCLHEDIFRKPGFAFRVVSHRNDIAFNFNDELDATLLVTEKRLQYWEENPDLMLPWMRLSKEVIIEPPSENILFLAELEAKLDPVPEPSQPKTKIQYKIIFSIPEEPWAQFLKWLMSEASFKETHSSVIFEHLISFYPDLKTKSESWFMRLREILESKIMMDVTEFSLELDRRNQRRELLKESFSIPKLRSLKPLLETHRELTSVTFTLLTLNYKISEIINFYLMISKLDLASLGLFESVVYQPRRNDFWGNQNTAENPRFSLLYQLFEEKKWRSVPALIEKWKAEDRNKHHLTDPVFIGPFNKWVKEICDALTLTAEGKDMNHCVGGYGNAIKSGRSRIFHLNVNGNHSTIELSFAKTIHPRKKIPQKFWTAQKQGIQEKRSEDQNKYEFKINQHKARFNKTPHKSNLIMGYRLVNYLNKRLSNKTHKEKMSEEIVEFEALFRVFGD